METNARNIIRINVSSAQRSVYKCSVGRPAGRFDSTKLGKKRDLKNRDGVTNCELFLLETIYLSFFLPRFAMLLLSLFRDIFLYFVLQLDFMGSL